MRLAEECKQVFTELQTDLADYNSDFTPATIPYHSFDEYALKVLFPGMSMCLCDINHPLVIGHCYNIEVVFGLINLSRTWIYYYFDSPIISAQDDYPVLYDPADLSSYEESLAVFEKLIRQV